MKTNNLFISACILILCVIVVTSCEKDEIQIENQESTLELDAKIVQEKAVQPFLSRTSRYFSGGSRSVHTLHANHQKLYRN